MCILKVRGVPDESDTENWYFGTWAMRQFYILYSLDTVDNKEVASISFFDSIEKDENNYDLDKKDKPPLTMALIVLISVSSLVVIAMLCFCIKWITNKRKNGEYGDQSVSINNPREADINVSISDMDREDTIRSTSSLAFRRYDTGGRTWIGQIKAADKKLKEQQESLNNTDDSLNLSEAMLPP